MSQHLLHFIVQGDDRRLPWDVDLTKRRILQLKARSATDAQSLCSAYPMTMIVADLTSWSEEARDALAGLSFAEGHRRPAVVGLLRFEATHEERREMGGAGLDALLHEQDSERAFLWPLEMLQLLGELSRFEQTRADVSQLANETRHKLHDLSQPLSAIQGRLQLMAAQANRSNDPNAQCLQDLVRLIFEVSRQLMEIQRLHRVYS
jgi:signal transduction histidine kinase